MADAKRISIRVEGHTNAGVYLLPDTLRQLGALTRLLKDFAKDPQHSRVEVLALEKTNVLTAELRVVLIPGSSLLHKDSGKIPRARAVAQPVRSLEEAYAEAVGLKKPRNLNAVGLLVLSDAAQQLKGDVAHIKTEKLEMRVDSSLIDQINKKLGPVHKSRGSITGMLEGLNIHAKPWSFTIYPEVGPRRIRCTFREDQFANVQHGIRKVVRVHGLKHYVAGSDWPVKIEAEAIDVLEPAPTGSWLKLAEELAELWDQTSEEERLMFLEESA